MVACRSCGYENRQGAKFCSECGAALAPTDAPAREERKVVTVLFADLVGFTKQAEQLDPEEVRAVLQPYHARLREELERFGGTVEKFIGDAVMALFGAPVAHEDDPERAVRAALRIRDAIVEEGRLHVRVGVTTGEVLVTLGARPSEGEGMAAGDVVNTAARLQAAAPTDAILVDEATYRASRDVIDYRSAEPVEAKGKAEPVQAWEAVVARARFGVDLAARSRADLVGRSEEMSLLLDALARVRRDREPQLVTITGVPGIGKSRLVYEMFKSVESGTDLTYWRQGRCLSYGDGVTFWALAEIAKSHAGILETDDADVTERKLRRAVREALGQDAEAEWVLRHLRPLVGLGTEEELAGDRRGEAFAAWRRLFEALAERYPLVLVVEDLQWADEGLLEFFEELVRWTSGVPLLALCTARPELFERRPGWGGGKLNAVTVSLSPLDDEQTAKLVHELLERSVLSSDLQTELLARAGGNPLYAEEFARMSAELGAGGDVPVPDSVQGIIAARLDLLQPEEKELLQSAAVIGKVFWTGAVVSLGASDADPLLRALEDKDFVRRVRRASVAGENEYAFRHILTRDVAYAQIPRARRAEKHRLAAEWIESLSADRTEDRAEMLAHHYLSALELSKAAGVATGAIEDRARSALRDAGDRASGLNAFAAAIRLYRAALALWPADDPERARTLLNYGIALWHGDASGRDELVAARDALLAAGDDEGAAEAETMLSRAAWYAGDRDSAFAHLERAAELVEGAPASRVKASVLVELSRLRALAGDSDAALERAEEALVLAEELDLEAVRVAALINMGIARWGVGERGPTELEQAVEAADAANLPDLSRAYNNLAVYYSRRGDLRRAKELLDLALDSARRFGDAPIIAFTRRGFLAHLAYMLGDWDEALGLAERSIAEAAVEPHYQEVLARRVRARIRFARGDLLGALEDSERALEQAERVKDPQALTPSVIFRARLLVEADRLDEAGRLIDGLFARLGPVTVGGDMADLGVICSALGRVDELVRYCERVGSNPWLEAALLYTRDDFVGAADLYAEIGAIPSEAHARLRAGESLASQGRRAEADVQLQRALSIAGELMATAWIREGEALLAATA